MLRIRAAGAVTAALLVVGVLSACTSSSSGRCVDYVGLPTAHDQFEAADLVVDAQVTRTGRTVADFGIYPEYRATVLKVLKGSASDATLRVISTSDQCETEGRPVEYVHGDPLARWWRLVLYLRRSEVEGVWAFVVPTAVDPPSVVKDPARR